MVDNIIGNSLKSYFKVHGITQREITERLDVKQSYIVAIFNGKGECNGVKVTDTYIDYDLTKVDEANRQVIDYVFYGKM